MGALEQHLQPVFERRTLECQTSRNEAEQHCLGLKKAKVFVEPTAPERVIHPSSCRPAA